MSISTVFFCYVQVRLIKQSGSKYIKNTDNYKYILSYFLNYAIILDHSVGFLGIECLPLAQISSVAVILLWANLYFWMRLFTSTAMYVDMIN